MGEIDGSFNETQLVQYFEKYGEKGKDGLMSHLGYLQYQVFNAYRKYNMQKQDDSCGTI